MAHVGYTITCGVFYHDLLITKFHHIDHKNYTDGIVHISKDRCHDFHKIQLSQ